MAQAPDDFIPVFHSAVQLLTDENFHSSPRESIEFRFLVSQ